MIDYTPLYEQISTTPLSHWKNVLPEKIAWNLREERYAHMPEWVSTLSRLPTCQPETIDLKDGVTAKGTCFAGTGKHADGTASVAKRAPTICTTFILIPNGDLTGSGIG